MKKIYISGKITDNPNAKEHFNKAEKELTKKGFKVVNPMDLGIDPKSTWIQFMRADIKAMCDCDSIYLLSNWADSKGARIEQRIATFLELEFLYEK
jgi:nucleoside 2-deoxyribosyltransferase